MSDKINFDDAMFITGALGKLREMRKKHTVGSDLYYKNIKVCDELSILESMVHEAEQLGDDY